MSWRHLQKGTLCNSHHATWVVIDYLFPIDKEDGQECLHKPKKYHHLSIRIKTASQVCRRRCSFWMRSHFKCQLLPLVAQLLPFTFYWDWRSGAFPLSFQSWVFPSFLLFFYLFTPTRRENFCVARESVMPNLFFGCLEGKNFLCFWRGWQELRIGGFVGWKGSGGSIIGGILPDCFDGCGIVIITRFKRLSISVQSSSSSFQIPNILPADYKEPAPHRSVSREGFGRRQNANCFKSALYRVLREISRIE